MDLWSILIEELKRIGFRSAQINELQTQFGSLDAAALLATPEDQFLPHMTGRSLREKWAKNGALLAAIEKVQARMDRQSRRDETITISGELKSLPQDILWQGLTVGLVDSKRAPQRILWQTAVEAGGTFAFQVPRRAWLRLAANNEARFRFRLLWQNRPLYSTEIPIAIAADPGASPIEIEVPRMAIARLQTMATPQRLRSELNVRRHRQGGAGVHNRADTAPEG